MRHIDAPYTIETEYFFNKTTHKGLYGIVMPNFGMSESLPNKISDASINQKNELHSSFLVNYWDIIFVYLILVIIVIILLLIRLAFVKTWLWIYNQVLFVVKNNLFLLLLIITADKVIVFSAVEF